MAVENKTKFKVGETVKIIGMHLHDALFDDRKKFINKIGVIREYGEYTVKGYFSGRIEINKRIYIFYAVKLERVKGVKEMEKKKFYGHPDFYKYLKEIAELHSRKNFNYARAGDPLSNFYACERFGLPAPWGCMTRMTDKDDRKVQVLLKGDVVGEDITQTSRDDAVYNLIFEILWKDFLKNKNAKEIIRMFREIKELLDSGKNNET